MEKRVESIVFRRMTYADSRHINKKGGEEVGGGGQSYIDFPTKDVPLPFWKQFLGIATGTGAENRPLWEFNIHSLGLNKTQKIKIYQRRAASVCIASQKIHSKEANRILSWHPNNNFPLDYDHNQDNLVIYIVKTIDKKYWAGWFLKNDIPKEWSVNDFLRRLFIEDSAGYIKFRSKVFIDTNNAEWPFYFNAKTIENQANTDEDIEEELAQEDTSVKIELLKNIDIKPEVRERIFKIRQRNSLIVKKLKDLYGGKCQLTGEKFTFLKKDGTLYCEVHHLIPLGEDGSDSYANAIVVSPLIHRMLHYAKVSEIDLSKIKNGKLEIFINDKSYTITWHLEHLKVVQESIEN